MSGAYPVAATINQNLQGTTQYSDYPAVAVPGQALVIPLWYNLYAGWNSGLSVMNASGDRDVTVTLTLYDQYGNPYYGNPDTQTLNPYQIYIFNNRPAGESFYGSVEISASGGPVAAMVNHLLSGGGNDPIMSTIAIHR
jgi:hypothetical protein